MQTTIVLYPFHLFLSAAPDVQVHLANIEEEDSSEFQTPQSSDIQSQLSGDASGELNEDGFIEEDEGSDISDKSPTPVDDEVYYDTDLEIEGEENIFFKPRVVVHIVIFIFSILSRKQMHMHIVCI